MWTVARRKKNGDPFFHRVTGLRLDAQAARQLSVYLNRVTAEYEWVWLQPQETHVTVVRTHARGKQKAQEIKVNDNGRLPFDTNPREAAEVEARVVALAVAQAEAKLAADEKAKGQDITWDADADAKAKADGGVQVIPLGPAGMEWFNVYIGTNHVGEVDHSPSGVAAYVGLPWVATLYLWKLDGAAQSTDISTLGRFADRDLALAAIVKKVSSYE